MARRLQFLAITLAGLALVALPACGVHGKQAAKTTSRSTATTNPTPRNTVTLTDAGTGAKAKLRLHFRRGARTDLAVKITSAITQDISGRHQRVTIPPIIENISLRIMEVKDGVASFHFDITGVKLDDNGSLSPEEARSVRSTLRRLVGLASDGKIDDRGTLLSSELHLPSSVPTSLRQVLQQLSDQLGALSVPLPEEPVGTGATWATSVTARLSGASVAIRSEYRLTAVKGTRFKLAVTQHQTAKPQPFQLPTLPPGARARIVKWDITSSGTNTLRLGNIFPEAKVRASGRQSFTVTPANSDPELIQQDLSIDTEVTDLGN